MIETEFDTDQSSQSEEPKIIALEKYFEAWKTEFPDLTYPEFEDLLDELEKIGHIVFVDKDFKHDE